LTQNSETVTVVAYASSDHTKNVVTSITVSAFASLLKGKYVLQTSGIDLTGFSYQFAGVVTLDGKGNITSGEQIYSNITSSVSDVITGGTYFIGPDGRGTLTLNTNDVNIGQGGVETFSLVYLSASQALIAKIDSPNIQISGNESSQGTMDLQTAVAAPAAGYAFVVTGIDVASQTPVSYGGILNIDSPNTISGNGSVADQDLAGGVTNSASISGTVSSPDAFGAVKFNLTAAFSSEPIQLTGYIVDATHIKLIESDNNGSGTGESTSGIAIGQGAATGTFTQKSAFSGNFVFGVAGEDLTSYLPFTLASAGVFMADGNGHLKGGFNDEFLDGLQITDAFHGKYTVDSTGTGRADSSITFKSNGPGPELIFYLTGNGNPALILDADNSVGAVGSGLAYTASSPVTFSGRYGTSLTYTSDGFGSENDASGQMTVNGTAGTLSGILDTNFEFSPGWDSVLTGTSEASTTPNRLTGTMSNQYFVFQNPIQVAYYLIDSGHGFYVENDGIAPTFGYFATRNQVCSSCP
jgi:hypothetical protein